MSCTTAHQCCTFWALLAEAYCRTTSFCAGQHKAGRTLSSSCPPFQGLCEAGQLLCLLQTRQPPCWPLCSLQTLVFAQHCTRGAMPHEQATQGVPTPYAQGLHDEP